MDNYRGVEIVWIKGRPWAECQMCHKLVRIAKPFLGGLHFCGR